MSRLQARFQNHLGSPCQQRQSGSVPVCCVTDLQGNILLRNLENYSDKLRRWRIIRARTTVTRYWTASVAFIQLTTDLPDLSSSIPFLKPAPSRIAYGWNGSGIAPLAALEVPLTHNDEICIYMGYLDRLRPIEAEDIEQNKLLRVFVGVVDTVTGAGTVAQGNTIAIQCRDRMKYLMDSLSSYNSGDATAFNVIQDLDGKAPTNKDDSQKTNPTRSQVILNIARRAIGDLRTSMGDGGVSQCGLACGLGIQGKAEGAFVADIGDSDQEAYNPYAPYIKDSKIGSQSVPFLGGRTENIPLSLAFPKFNILTGRTAYEGTAENFGNAQNFIVADRVPVEYIRYLAMQEPNPTEVFVDHQTGDFWYTPRGCDVSSLDDPKRLNRTYYYRQYPEGVVPDLAQMLLVCKEERSTISWRSNILVTQSTNNDTQQPLTVHLRVVPSWLKNRAYACTYYTVTDPTAKNVAELAAIALTFARTMSKEVRAMTIHTLGDPSLTPGEAVQVIGSLLNPQSLTNWEEDRKTFKQYYAGYTDFSKDLIEKIKNDGSNTSVKDSDQKVNTQQVEYDTTSFAENKTIINAKSVAGTTNATILCNKEGGGEYGDTNVLKFKAQPESIWRIESVIHRFNDGTEGYKSELALSDPLG